MTEQDVRRLVIRVEELRNRCPCLGGPSCGKVRDERFDLCRHFGRGCTDDLDRRIERRCITNVILAVLPLVIGRVFYTRWLGVRRTGQSHQNDCQ